MSYYYDQKHQKVCTARDGLVSVSKVTADTKVTNCSQPVAAYEKKFSEVRNFDAKLGETTNAINFASIYDDKVTQSSSEACNNNHCEWLYGDYINYDHLPAKSIYDENCSGNKGGKLPTVTIMAIDHKGPVWSYRGGPG